MNNILSIQETIDTIPLIYLAEEIKTKLPATFDKTKISHNIYSDDFKKYYSNPLYSIDISYSISSITIFIKLHNCAIYILNAETGNRSVWSNNAGGFTYVTNKTMGIYKNYYYFINSKYKELKDDNDNYSFSVSNLTSGKRYIEYNSVPKNDEEYFMKSLVHELPEREDLDKYFSEMHELCSKTNTDGIGISGYPIPAGTFDESNNNGIKSRKDIIDYFTNILQLYLNDIKN